MAGPRMIGVDNIIDPYARLQDSVSQVGNIYRNFEEDQRRTTEANMKIRDYNREETARAYLSGYDPNLGTDLRGLNDNDRRFAQEQETKLLADFDAKNANNPNAAAERAKLLETFNNNRRQLVSRESAESVIFQDLIRNNVNPQTAAIQAKALATKYQGENDLYDNHVAAVTARNDSNKARADQMLELYKIERQYPDYDIRRSAASGGGGAGSGGGSGGDPLKTNMDIETFLKERNGPWDGRTDLANISDAVTFINQERAASKLPPIRTGQLTDLIARSSPGDRGIWNNKSRYASSGDWVNAINDEITNNPSRYNSTSSGVIERPRMSDQDRQTLDSLWAKHVPLSREQFSAQRVQSIYGTLSQMSARDVKQVASGQSPAAQQGAAQQGSAQTGTAQNNTPAVSRLQELEAQNKALASNRTAESIDTVRANTKEIQRLREEQLANQRNAQFGELTGVLNTVTDRVSPTFTSVHTNPEALARSLQGRSYGEISVMLDQVKDENTRLDGILSELPKTPYSQYTSEEKAEATRAKALKEALETNRRRLEVLLKRMD